MIGKCSSLIAKRSFKNFRPKLKKRSRRTTWPVRRRIPILENVTLIKFCTQSQILRFLRLSLFMKRAKMKKQKRRNKKWKKLKSRK